MRLFGDFEAVKFFEEDIIFVTHKAYIYYIYENKYRTWRKYRNAGNDYITVKNYGEVSKEELIEAMQGIFPTKETDFMRLCSPYQLCIRDMLELLKEDYSEYMAESPIYHTCHHFLLESDICYKSYLAIREIFDNACRGKLDNRQVLNQIKDCCLKFFGRDIFKKEIGIVDGHDGSSYFWIMPVRIIDSTDTTDIDNIAEMRAIEISIEEDDVNQYLTPFLYKYFNDELEANAHRSDAVGFEWYLTYNFFTMDSIRLMLQDIKDTIVALFTGSNNEFTVELKKKRGTPTYQLLYARDLSEEQIKEYNDNRPKEDDTEMGLIIDFYQRFVYRMEYMIKVGQEKGYDLISFMGP